METRSILWKDSIPAEKDVELIPAASKASIHGGTRAPVKMNMNFGGAHGEKLAILNLVVIAVDVQSGLLKGFTFRYDDGTSASYGSRHSISSDGLVRPCQDVSFRVRGKEGERITKICVFKSVIHQPPHIRAFIVWPLRLQSTD